MPLPICPAPITPTFLILPAISLSAREPFYDERPSPPNSRPRALFLRKLIAKLGQRLEQIGDEPVIRDLEDRRFLIFVDGDDDLRILHAGELLNRAPNA